MNVNETYYGFKLLKKRTVEDIKSEYYEFEHLKSGAKLCFIENDDKNKVFDVSFRTLPHDSTGVCHIIEHTLLCGSKKYPLKEPFVNLLKGSMATFLNAMTAQDFTTYPVASLNDKDFDNLMSTYLDACFNPISIIDDKPFLQEGWHLEMEDKNSIPEYKGVVYNEMKGAMSSVYEILNQETCNALYEGTGYGVNSGGDPEKIVDLTFEDYKKFYNEHYHPENSLFVLYGKMDLLPKLKFIDEEYLSKYERTGNKIEIEYPKDLINENWVKEYPISEEDDESNQYYYSYAFGIDHYENQLDAMAIQVLDEVLMTNNESPLKKALLKYELSEDIETMFNEDSIKPFYCFNLVNAKEGVKEEFKNAILTELKKIKEDGIDKEALLSTINNSEFKFKEMDNGSMPKGLILGQAMICPFLYGLDIDSAFEVTKIYKELKNRINSNYYEEIIEKYFLSSKHNAIVTLIPSKTLLQESEMKMKEKMEEIKKNMTDEEIEECIKKTKELIAYQSKEDTPEELKTLPTLDLSDISYDFEAIDSKIDGNVITHEVSSNGISYLKMYFDLHSLTVEEMFYANMLGQVYNSLDTINYENSKLISLMKMYIGSLSYTVYVNPLKNTDEFRAYAIVQISALDENVSHIHEFANEIMNNLIFDKLKIQMVLTQIKNMMKTSAVQYGHSIAQQEIQSMYNAALNLQSKLQGLYQIEFISRALENIDETVSKIESVYKKIFNRNALTLSLSASSKEAIYSLRNEVSQIDMTNEDLVDALEPDVTEKRDFAYVVPSDVNYCAYGASLKEIGYEVDGKIDVLAHILRLYYLWSEVRVKGGAYGAMISFGHYTGIFNMSSYRDPNCLNTYEVYKHVADFLSQFNPSEDEFKTIKIGAIGGIMKALSLPRMISSSDFDYLLGKTLDDKKKNLKEMIETTIDDIKNYQYMFDKLDNVSVKVAVGNENKLKEYPEFKEFKRI